MIAPTISTAKMIQFVCAARCSVRVRGSVTSRTGARASTRVWLAIDDPPAGEAVLQNRQNENDEKEQERQRRAVAVAIVLEKLLEDQDASRRRGVAGPAARHHV